MLIIFFQIIYFILSIEEENITQNDDNIPPIEEISDLIVHDDDTITPTDDTTHNDDDNDSTSPSTEPHIFPPKNPKIFSFELIDTIKNANNNLTIDSLSTYIFPNNISIIKNLSLENKLYNTLISTNLSESVFKIKLAKNNIEDEAYCPKDRLKLNNSQFIFQICDTYNNITLTQTDNQSIQKMYKISSVEKSNSIIEYDSILSLQSLENTSMVVLDYINKNIKIIEEDENSDELINETIKNMVECSPTGSKFSCNVTHLLFGMEGELDDPFLANDISKKNYVAFFDNLSSYHIFPGDYLEYFLTSFFSKYNDECEKKRIKDTTLFYITCSRKKIEIFSFERNMSVIINNNAFPLKNLFNGSFGLLEDSSGSSTQLIYFNILFNESSHDFIFGSNFFMGKKIAYNYKNDKTYIYCKDSVNYASTFSDENSPLFKKVLYILTLGLFSCFLIMSAIMTCLHTRKVNKELETMFKS